MTLICLNLFAPHFKFYFYFLLLSHWELERHPLHPQQHVPSFFASRCFLQSDFIIPVITIKSIAHTITVPIISSCKNSALAAAHGCAEKVCEANSDKKYTDVVFITPHIKNLIYAVLYLSFLNII